MDYLKVILISLISLSGIIAQQRSPPGVNPQQYQQGQGHQNTGQQYQQPPQQPQQQQYNQMGPAAPGVPPGQYQPQQQYQQQPQAPQQQQYQPQQQQQYQQPPPQQPPPQQQQPQQQQFQQAPQQHAGGHSHPEKQRVLHSNNLQEEREHIKEHMEVPLDTSGMSDEELQFHYFKMHDADNNNRLDGQELIKSLLHWHDASNHDPSKTGQTPPPPKIFTDLELTNMIDPIMDQDDRNRDGYIDYPEFVHAQSKAAAAAAEGGS